MAISAIAVNYRSIFANGTLTTSASGTSWSNAARLIDYFIQFLAATAAAPSGESVIQVDQGSSASAYFSANRLIIPASHNLDVALTLEYSANGSSWTGVTLSPSATPVPGTLFDASFTKVAAASGNRYWRLRFTKTGAVVQIPEVWLTEKVVLGQSETTAGEAGYNAEDPLDIAIDGNFVASRSIEGVRSAVSHGAALRGFRLTGKALSDLQWADWQSWIVGTGYGLAPFFLDDPDGMVRFAEIVSPTIRIEALRRTVDLEIRESA